MAENPCCDEPETASACRHGNEPVIGNPANRKRSVMLSYDQFRFAFVNAVAENEAKRLYNAYPVPGSGIPLFQAAFANLNAASETKVEPAAPTAGR